MAAFFAVQQERTPEILAMHARVTLAVRCSSCSGFKVF
jgi:hypothetical protein